MFKAAYVVILIGLLSCTALAQSLEDAPLPAAVSLVKEGSTLKFTDDNGQSLYTSDRDLSGHSSCDGACAAMWPPVVASEGEHTIGDWTPIRRSDNSQQWAYKGKPIYTYKGDTEPGQTKGAGIDGVWHVLTP